MKYWKSKSDPLGLPIHKLSLEELTPLYTFHPKVKQDVLDSIKKTGILNPLIVVPHGAISHKLPGYEKIGDKKIPPSKYYVYTGNNRYWAASQLNLTHIDAYICEDLKKLPDLEQKMYINPRFYDENTDSTRSS